MIADKFDKGYGHFTTRQNIQFNWIKLAEIPDALEALADVEMHCHPDVGKLHPQCDVGPSRRRCARRTRRPAPMVRDHPPVVDLPSGILGPAAQVQDRGDRRDARPRGREGPRHRPSDEEERRRRNRLRSHGRRRPWPHALYRSDRARLGPKQDLLSYLEAIMRVYNRHGRRDNKYKARIKILVHELGASEFARQVEEEFAAQHAWEKVVLPQRRG